MEEALDLSSDRILNDDDLMFLHASYILAVLLISCHSARDPVEFVLFRTRDYTEKLMEFAPIRLPYIVISRLLACPVKYGSLKGLNVPLKHNYSL